MIVPFFNRTFPASESVGNDIAIDAHKLRMKRWFQRLIPHAPPVDSGTNFPEFCTNKASVTTPNLCFFASRKPLAELNHKRLFDMVEALSISRCAGRRLCSLAPASITRPCGPDETGCSLHKEVSEAVLAGASSIEIDRCNQRAAGTRVRPKNFEFADKLPGFQRGSDRT